MMYLVDGHPDESPDSKLTETHDRDHPSVLLGKSDPAQESASRALLRAPSHTREGIRGQMYMLQPRMRMLLWHIASSS